MSLLPRFLILAVSVVCVYCKTEPLPSYVTGCSRNDPIKLNECAKINGQAAIPRLVKGDRKYRIPSLDPLEIVELAIDRSNGSVSMDFKVNNVKIFGFGNTQIKSAVFDLEQKVITMKLFAPSIHVTGDYVASGNVLILPINGKGLCNITLDNNDFTYLVKYNLVKKADGIDYFVPYEYNLSGKPAGAHFLLDNLFNGNKALSDNINQVLNDNWEIVIDELGPPLLEGVGFVLMQVLATALRDVPYDVIFPPKT